MSITIQLEGKHAVLADGQWRSADETVQALLNDHLGELNLPAHLPWQAREKQAAQAAVRDFGATIVATNQTPPDETRAADGSLKIY